MANISDAQGHIFTVSTLVYGQVCQNVFRYYNIDPTHSADPADAADNFVSEVVPLWRECIATGALLLGVTVEATAFGLHPPYAPAVRSINLAGTVSGDVLAPFVVARIYKQPDPTESDPSTPPTPWRLGMTRISGLSEAGVGTGGVIGTATLANLQALGTELVGYDLSGEGYLQYLQRNTDADPENEYFVPVTAMFPSPFLGSQNTRKIAF